MPRNLGSGSRLVDLGVVCLICLRAESGYCSIYGQDLETPHMQIVDKIRSCSALQLEKPLLSQLPDKICHGCRNELSITYRFQQKCLAAQKVFQSAATATLLLDVDKLQLQQHQMLKLPSSLRIKRLETEPASNRVKYFSDIDASVKIMNPDVDAEAQAEPGADATLVLQDMTAVTSDNEDDKMLAMNVIWATEQTQEQQQQQQCELEEDNDEQDLVQELDLGQELDRKDELEPDDEDFILPDEQREDAQATLCGVSATNMNSTNSFNSINSISGSSINMNNSSSSSVVVARSRRSAEPKICDICGNTYKYQHALNAHMRRHNNERPYPCEVCQKAFISNVELRRHMRVHTGQKPYGCHYCERRFSDFGSSKKHERIHTGERPYVCEVCNKGFAYAHVLSVHRRTHTGKKQFQCTQCDKGFTKKCYLATHLEQHRSKQPSMLEVANATLLRLPTRKHHQQRQQEQLRYEEKNEIIDAEGDVDDDDYEDDNVSVGIDMNTLSHVGGEQAKVLEECIVNNDFMFHDEEADETEHDMDDYHDTELDDSEFQDVEHVKVPYGLVGDLLDAEDLVSDAKYLME